MSWQQTASSKYRTGVTLVCDYKVLGALCCYGGGGPVPTRCMSSAHCEATRASDRGLRVNRSTLKQTFQGVGQGGGESEASPGSE